MKKLVSILILIVSIFGFVPSNKIFAENGEDFILETNQEDIVYLIYNEKGELIAEKQTVFVGDSILTKDFIKYKIIQLDEEKHIAFAEFEEKVKMPEVNISFTPSQISQENPTICLYMTHNDESYISGDGYDSVYGAGGIHDVAKSLQTNLEYQGINTYIDETLHIPHDIYAYSRSSATAKSMLKMYSPDAIFDIHRDGASRSTYVKNIGGKERCKIRIVVGKASANFEVAEQFALYLLSVANKVCDWLFLDIYYASGHYNQGLYSKALLFEMGSHLVEKSLVMESVPELAKVINTALFNTTVNKDSGELTINGNKTDETPIISEALEEYSEEIAVAKSKKSPTIVYFIVVLSGGVGIAVLLISILKTKKRRKSKRKK